MEDYGNRLDDYVNGHEQDDDDGDVERFLLWHT